MTFQSLSPKRRLPMLAKATARSEETVGFCFYSTICHCVWSGLTECLSSRSLWTALFTSYRGPFAFAACLKLPQHPLLRKFLQYHASPHCWIPAPHPVISKTTNSFFALFHFFNAFQKAKKSNKNQKPKDKLSLLCPVCILLEVIFYFFKTEKDCKDTTVFQK